MQTTTTTRTAKPHGTPLPSSPDYEKWTVEELRAFALQMRLPEAGTLTRRELLEIFSPPARPL